MCGAGGLCCNGCEFEQSHAAFPPSLSGSRPAHTQGERLAGSLSAIKARAPVLGGNFGIWGGLFASFDCAVKGYRQKEDPWNAIIAGFCVGGTLAFRGE